MTTVELPEGRVLFRVFVRDRPPLAFGRDGRGWFDAPDGAFGTCDFALEPQTAIVETLLRDPARRFVDRRMVETRTLGEAEVVSPLRLADLRTTAALQRRGLDLRAVHDDYARTRRLAARLHEGEPGLDGLLWPSRLGADGTCLVLFERAAAGVRIRRIWPDGLWRAEVVRVAERCGKALR